MELWERSDALAALDALLQGTATGGRVALVAGEAGIGKSALVHAFAARAGSRARFLWGACDPLVTPRASGPLLDIAHQVGGTLAARLAAGAGRQEVFAALVDELSGPRQRQRRVVVVEDAHWADEATLDTIVFLGRRIDRLGALLLVTYRDDEVGPEHPLHAALAALPRGVVRYVAVPPLSAACVALQAAAAGREPAETYALTGGNPLLVTELLAAGDRTVPPTVRDLVLARLAVLPAPARDVARLVAVMPTSTEATVLDGLEEAVDACVAAGLLVSRDDTVAYRHELLRRAVEDSLSSARRVALHRRALGLLAGIDGTDPARLVHHARLAGDAQAVLRHGLPAAEQAAAQGAHREAVAHHRAVRPHLRRLTGPQRAATLEAYAVQAYLANVADEGLDALREALVEWEAIGDPVRVGANLRWTSRLAWWAGRSTLARQAATRAVRVLEADGEPGRELAMAYSNRSQLHMLAHELPAAIEWGERAQELAGRLGDVDTSLHASANVAAARLQSGHRAGAVALRRLHVEAAAAGFTDHAARALVNQTASLVELSDYLAAETAADLALRYVEANHLDGYLKYLLGVRSMIRLERGEWDAALADAQESLARPGGAGQTVVPALVAKGRILSARGETGALSILDEAMAVAEQLDELQRIGPVTEARAEHFLLVGEPLRAAVEARRGLELAVAKSHAWFAGALSHRLWQAGDPTGGGIPEDDLPTPYRLLRAGDWAGAAAAWAALGRRHARLGALALGDPAAAAEAVRGLDALGAVRAAGRLRAQLRGRGMAGVPRGPRPATVANAAGLTARQLEVLRLLAQGLTYAQIATRLTLSTKTVEHHISAVLEKLAAANRGQAVAAAHRLGLIGAEPQT